MSFIYFINIYVNGRQKEVKMLFSFWLMPCAFVWVLVLFCSPQDTPPTHTHPPTLILSLVDYPNVFTCSVSLTTLVISTLTFLLHLTFCLSLVLSVHASWFWSCSSYVTPLLDLISVSADIYHVIMSDRLIGDWIPLACQLISSNIIATENNLYRTFI